MLPLSLLLPQLPLALHIALAGALCGLIYIRIAPEFIRRFSNLLPPIGDGALVGLGVGSLSALGYWAVAGALLPGMHQESLPLIASITSQWPGVMGFTAISAGIAGMVRSLVGSEWMDL